MTVAELALALVAAVATPLSVVVVAWLGGRRLAAVHTLVNDRLEQALNEIRRLETRLLSDTSGALPAIDSVADLRNERSSG